MKTRMLELDAIRGIAALSVLLFHFSMKKEIAGKEEHIFAFGVTGVDLFFMLSGFVIFLTLSNTKKWQDFVINRFIRLYPTYWIACTFTVILILLDINNAGIPRNLLRDYLINLTMFQHYFSVPDLDGPYWTLIIEMLFYISIFFVFLIRKMDKIEVLGLVALLFVIFYDLILQHYYYRYYFFFKHYFKLINHFPFFFAGILFYKIKFERITYARCFGLILCFVVGLMLFDNVGRSSKVIDITSYALLIGLYFIIWIMYLIDKLKFIVNRGTLFLGRISYSLYLTHQFLGLEIMTFFTSRYGFNFWFATVVAMVISLLSASIITVYFEEPIIKTLRAKLLNKSTRYVVPAK